MATNEDFFSSLLELDDVTSLSGAVAVTRDICQSCNRPNTVCICASFPKDPLNIHTHLIILQHPNEIKRPMATVPLLSKCVVSKKCTVLRGKNFSPLKYPIIRQCLENRPQCAVLYPLSDAIVLPSSTPIPAIQYLIVIDGTWRQAKSMYKGNNYLSELTHLSIDIKQTSQYVIRTQPTDSCLSTIEAIAFCLEHIEGDPLIPGVLLSPLKALCSHQLIYGAKTHVSKEREKQLAKQADKSKIED
ncbi:DTW domain-containing protein 2-like isoform X1 [Oopsacas minuta]|uniref:tRNA-uridine aminocarboxypropyltransferase n=1 Tax=Oopsacas minuta TaxID=111878 RepID=A0AAV7JKL9_9METZ|nr:DTW domain-containing protein 2-like isoform X1 [Oopsacas minuta]